MNCSSNGRVCVEGKVILSAHNPIQDSTNYATIKNNTINDGFEHLDPLNVVIDSLGNSFPKTLENVQSFVLRNKPNRPTVLRFTITHTHLST